MPEEIGANNQTITSWLLNHQASSSASSLTPGVPVSTARNISLLPAALPSTSQAVYHQPAVCSLPQTFLAMPSAQLLSFDTPLCAPEPPQTNTASSALQQYSTLPANMQPYLAEPASRAPGEFYQRVRKALDQNGQSGQKRQKLAPRNPAICSTAGLLRASSLSSPHQSDRHAVTSSAAAVHLVSTSSISGSLQNSARKPQSQSSSFTSFFYTGVNLSPEDKYKFLGIKAQRFLHFFSEEAIQTALRLCRNWQTTDLESVLRVHKILTGKLTLQQFETLSSDDISFRCYVNKTRLDPSKPVLSNMEYHDIRVETETEFQETEVQVENWHQAIFSGECNSDYRITPKDSSVSPVKGDGIVFNVVLTNTLCRISDNVDTIEVSCTLTELLMAKAQIDNQKNTVITNRVFVRLPPGTTVNCTILERPAADRLIFR